MAHGGFEEAKRGFLEDYESFCAIKYDLYDFATDMEREAVRWMLERSRRPPG